MVDGKVGVADFITEKVRTLAVRVVLGNKIVVFGEEFVLILVGCSFEVGNPLGLHFG